jgi:hypothetical protein
MYRYVFSIDIPFKGNQSLAKMMSKVTALSYLHSGVNDSVVHVTAESMTPLCHVQPNTTGKRTQQGREQNREDNKKEKRTQQRRTQQRRGHSRKRTQKGRGHSSEEDTAVKRTQQ